MSRSVLAGETINLYCEVYSFDTTGNKVLTDPDSTPIVSIFDAFHDPRESSTDLVTDALVYRANATRVTTGVYYYSYTPAASAMTNYWFDYWEITLDSVSGTAAMQFYVIGEEAGTTPLGNNMLVEITLDENISDTNGNSLGADYVFWFTTEFDPMYSDPKLVRLYAGNWVNGIPDETLFLMLYESSKLADDITPTGICINTSLYNNARTRFVTLDSIFRLLSIPVNQGGMTKSLGDLLVKRGEASFMNMLDRAAKERLEWRRVVNSGGNIGPGESYAPISVVKGARDPDRLNAGRRWLKPGRNDTPGVNGRVSLSGNRLQRYFYIEDSNNEDYD